MILRFIALLVLPLACYYLAQALSTRFNFTRRQRNFVFVFLSAVLVTGVLIALGRLPIQFILAPIGVAATFMVRFLPTLIRFLPIWQMFKNRTTQSIPNSSNSSSSLRTRFLAMELSHQTGDMTGEVLDGRFVGKKLDELKAAQVQELFSECIKDSDSRQVLLAYIERMHPDWAENDFYREDEQQDERTDEMSRPLALEILGLADGATYDEVVSAHRSLMRKMHPDRGGSDYLAKKINLAKEVLLKKA